MKMLKRGSIKFRITMWYTIFIMLIIVFLVGILLVSQSIFSQDFYTDELNAAMSESTGSLQTMDDIYNMPLHLDSGVNVTVLDENGELLVGRRSFAVGLREGTIHVRQADTGNFVYLMDKPVTLINGSRVWVRCYMSTAVTKRSNQTLWLTLLIAIPIFLFFAIFGGFLLTKRAFQSLDSIIGIAENISTSTDLKQRVRIANQEDEVGRLADTFDGMLVRLERSLEDEKTFISDASHELRTPLSVIRAQSEFALAPGRTLDEKNAALEIILARSEKAGQMLSQMLLLSQMDYEKLPLNIERVDISELLERIAEEMRASASERGITIECDIEHGIYCACDELLIIRMATNLIENAIQYGRENGHIWLALRRGERDIELNVKDDGIGIPEADIQRIWQRFYQVNKSGDETSGFGLGLSIVKWIVEAHDGKISVTSAPGDGSSFLVELPANDKSAMNE